MRVGFWRFLEALESRKIKATFAVNGSALTVVPLRPELFNAWLDATPESARQLLSIPIPLVFEREFWIHVLQPNVV